MTITDTGSANEKKASIRKPNAPLRRGWTTGACATAATKAALTAIFAGEFPDPVTITLPKGETPSFALIAEKLNANSASASIVKDAGDDPDVTHGATITAELVRGAKGSGIVFEAGDGVGMVTKAGLPVPVGHPAINPVPRSMMISEVEALCATYDCEPDFIVRISVDNGAELAKQTWNPRLGIEGGLSILGTTGVVHPFSCSAWIHSIHRGVDVSRAAGIDHILAATGSTSEAAAQAIYQLPDYALIDMGDFAGGLLKYLRAHPIRKLTIAGGFAKLTKLAQGAMDLHSSRSQVDFDWLSNRDCFSNLNQSDKSQIQNANTAMEVLEIAGKNSNILASEIATKAQNSALRILRGAPVEIEIIVTDRSGEILAQTGFAAQDSHE